MRRWVIDEPSEAMAMHNRHEGIATTRRRREDTLEGMSSTPSEGSTRTTSTTTPPTSQEAKGGGAVPTERPPGGSCEDAASVSKGPQPSVSLFSVPPRPKVGVLRGKDEGGSPVPRVATGPLEAVEIREVVVPVEKKSVEPLRGLEEEGEDEEPLALAPAESADEWLNVNTPRILEESARRAMSWRDPMFSTMFVGKLLDVQIARTKAVGKVAGAALGALAPGERALMAKAREIASLSPADAMSRLNEIEGEG